MLPDVAAHLVLIIAGDVELVPAVVVQVEKDGRVLETRRVRGNERLLPGVPVAPDEPQPSLVRRCNDLQLAVSIDVSGVDVGSLAQQELSGGGVSFLGGKVEVRKVQCG